VTSEIVINVRRFQKGMKGKHDKFSYSILLVTTGISIMATVYFDHAGIVGPLGTIRWGSPLVGYSGCGLMIAGVGMRWIAIKTLQKQFTVNVAFGELIIFVLNLIAHIYRIRVEEDALVEYFGNDYKNYCRAHKTVKPRTLLKRAVALNAMRMFRRCGDSISPVQYVRCENVCLYGGVVK
jgi:protein-S-isoprenylcysteine O-methyltransferase Ste14